MAFHRPSQCSQLGAPIFFDVFNHKFRARKMIDERTHTMVVHGVGPIAHDTMVAKLDIVKLFELQLRAVRYLCSGQQSPSMQ